MAHTHLNLGPLEGYDKPIRWGYVFARLNARVVRWVFGAGFLFFHLALFGAALLIALSWNLIAQPTNLQVADPFRYWGIAAIVHTILLGVGMLGWQLFQMGQPQVTRYQIPPIVGAHTVPRPQIQKRGQAWQTAWTKGYSSVQRVNASARNWSGSPPRRNANWGSRDIKQGWPVQPAGLRSDTDVEQSTSANADVGEATWPDSAPISTILASGVEPRLANESDHLLAVDHRTAATARNPSQTWIEGFIASRSNDKENRWSWVEAAAASWLSKREATPMVESTSTADRESVNPASTAPDSDKDRPDATSH